MKSRPDLVGRTRRLTVSQEPVHIRPRTIGTASQSPLRAATYLVRAVAALGLALVRRWPAATETLGQEK